MSPTPSQFVVSAEASLFGFASTPSTMTVLARSRRWRVTSALVSFTVAVSFAAPLVVFPPHAVWPLGGLAVGIFLAHRRYIERFTLLSATGQCPKCEQAFSIQKMRLRSPHPLPCDRCHHEITLRLPHGTLQDHALD